MMAADAVFDSFHRALICLDTEFRIVHASASLSELIGEEATGSLTGRPVQELFGDELFGAGGAMRNALQQGELREGIRTTMHIPGGGTRLVFCSVAPVSRDSRRAFDPRVAYVIIVRSAEGLGHCSAMTAEAERIRVALEQHQWQREATARSLGMSRTTLWRKMREAGLARNST